jgi:hypothetical protein
MNMSDRPALELLDAMFPGDPARMVPAAAVTGAPVHLAALFPHLDEIDALIAGEALPDDPGAALKILKSRAPDLIDRFVEQAVVAYFSDPAVARALTGKPTPLFPNLTVMPDIDYDLLEPVLQVLGHPHD